MEKSPEWVKNFNELAITPNRKIALEIMEAGLNAINTEKVIVSLVSLVGNVLSIKGKKFDLTKFKRIKVVGFGKSSCEAALALEKILGSKIGAGAVVGLKKISCKYIETFAGTHPEPTETNISAGKRIYKIVDKSNEDDLIIVLVSGGGSALLCSSENECRQGQSLYEASLKSKEKITELNTVRKHIPSLKGGNLAKLVYPATVIGLIFSDVPGDHYDDVASGPTYKDETTVADAEKIIEKHNLGHFDLEETPKEDKYFEKVHNFVLVSNKIAVEAMAKKGEELGLKTKIVSTELYDEVNLAVEKIFSTQESDTLVLAAGEPGIEVKNKNGKGGRNLHMGLTVIKNKIIDQNSVFVSFASDGMDNSDVAGAVVDKNTEEKAKKMNLNFDDYFNSFDSYSFFQKTGDMIITGPTGANVSDLMILLTKNGK